MRLLLWAGDVLVLLLLSLVAELATAQRSRDACGHIWTYEGQCGPSHWATRFRGCGGKRQSPINIKTDSVIVDYWHPFVFKNYYVPATSIRVANNGHTAKVEMNPKASFRVSQGGLIGDYIFTQMTFHWGADSAHGSEHTIDGVRYPLEMHIVNYKASYGDLGTAIQKHDGLAVLAVMFEVSNTDNPALTPLFNALANITDAGAFAEVATTYSLQAFLPKDTEKFYRYQGSLNTPTCNEVVIWTVFNTTVEVSESQLNALRLLRDVDGSRLINNYRPVQPLNYRKVFVMAPITKWERIVYYFSMWGNHAVYMWGNIADYFSWGNNTGTFFMWGDSSQLNYTVANYTSTVSIWDNIADYFSWGNSNYSSSMWGNSSNSVYNVVNNSSTASTWGYITDYFSWGNSNYSFSMWGNSADSGYNVANNNGTRTMWGNIANFFSSLGNHTVSMWGNITHVFPSWGNSSDSFYMGDNNTGSAFMWDNRLYTLSNKANSTGNVSGWGNFGLFLDRLGKLVRLGSNHDRYNISRMVNSNDSDYFFRKANNTNSDYIYRNANSTPNIYVPSWDILEV